MSRMQHYNAAGHGSTSWLNIVGANPKDVRALMRDSRASTTLDVYQQHVPESQRYVVNQLTKLGKLRLGWI